MSSCKFTNIYINALLYIPAMQFHSPQKVKVVPVQSPQATPSLLNLQCVSLIGIKSQYSFFFRSFCHRTFKTGRKGGLGKDLALREQEGREVWPAPWLLNPFIYWKYVQEGDESQLCAAPERECTDVQVCPCWTNDHVLPS